MKNVIPQIENIEEKAENFLCYLKENHSGKKNSIMAKRLTQWGNTRDIRKLVHFLRKESHPICSGNRGYFYGVNREEISVSMGFVVNHHKMEAVKGLERSLALYA